MKKTFLSALLFLLLCLPLPAKTVVVIHGMFVSARTMAPIQHALDKCFSVCLFEFDSRRETIQDVAMHLNKQLQCLARQHPGEPIYFATHSIGGVVLKTALNLPCCPAEAKCGRAVLLAPPAQGACLARTFKDNVIVRLGMGSKSGYELMTYTPREMACLGEFPSTMEVLVIAGTCGINPFFRGQPNDGCLRTVETRLNTPHCYKELHLKHGGLINNPCSLRLTRNFLLHGI